MIIKDKSLAIRYLAVTAMLGAVSFVLQLLEFPIPFLIPFIIQFDFSDLPALIASFSMGPISGVAVALIKNVLHLIVFPSQTGGVGELANFLLTSIFVGTAGIVYLFQKNRSGALIGSLTGAFVMSVVSVPVNLFITYPIYYIVATEQSVAVYTIHFGNNTRTLG